MKTYYFTFGSEKKFPYPDGYMTIEAETEEQAIAIFRAVHPDRDPRYNIYNAADVYTSEEWERNAGKYYAGMAPSEEIKRIMWVID